MVKVISYQKRVSKTGDSYFALELQSDELEFAVSKETGRHYATLKKCWISSTFNEEICELMLGKQMPGRIKKVRCDPYSFRIEESGEVISLEHRYEYVPEDSSAEEAVFGAFEESVPA